MDLEKCKIAIENYCQDFAEQMDSLVYNKCITKAQAEEQKKKNRKGIEAHLQEFEEYGRVILSLSNSKRSKEKYLSLTALAKEKNKENPSYVIQSWLRNKNTISFLRIWEQYNNSNFDSDKCKELLERVKVPSFTLTAKKWIAETGAIGIVSKQDNNGETLAHVEIALDFQLWLWPEKRYEVIKFVSGDMMKR